VKIAVNTRLLIPNRLEGIGRFTYEIFKRLVLAHPEVEFHFFSDRKPLPEWQFGSNVFQHCLLPPARRPFLFDWWFDWAVPRKLKQLKIDLFVSPDGHASRKKINQLCVIHDLNFMHHPEFLIPQYAKYWRTRTPEFIQYATRIATVSEFSKQDLCATFSLDSEKIDVIGNGFNSSFKPISEEQKKQTQLELTGGRPYFLFVGSLHPRKNVHGIVKAFNAFCNENSTHDLILAGRLFWDYPELKCALNEAYTGRVHEIGFLPNEKLPGVYASAEALVFPSFYEGFGIPLLEAEMCGIPVITTKGSAMEEISNGTAWLVNPYKTEEIVEAMNALVAGQRKMKLRDTGMLYTWESATERMWNSILKTR
jgi:glycosyltransferase involved in cell wall biosynthesis